jgi:single-stranded-DNA-specific exonuclease
VTHAGAGRQAIWYHRAEPLPERVTLAYRLSLDEFNGRLRVQMVVEGVAP